MPEIRFGSLDAANRIRNNPKYQGFLAESDNAGSKTLELKDATPEPALNDIQGEAAETKEHKADEHGQIPLTDEERKQIDFSATNVLHARAVKGIARGKGIDDWTAFYDTQASVDDHRSILEDGKGDDRGRRGLGQDQNSEAVIDKKYASAYKTQKRESLGKAKDYAFSGDREAQEEVRSEGPLSETADISFSRTESGELRGRGRDYERLEEAHESRSERAKTLDEKKSAQPTRDPFQWTNNKSKFDYPGIDTVQPDELHGKRSPQSRARDERSAAPLTENKQQWAMNPGRYDYEGVDDVDPEKLHASRSKRAREQDEGELAPIADSKQQWAKAPGRWDWRGVDTPSEDLTFVDGDSGSSSGGGMEFFREIDGKRMPASAILDERPRSPTVDAPGLSPEDFEGVGFTYGEQKAASKGIHPADQETPAGRRKPSGRAKELYAGGEEADMAFIDAEMNRSQDDIASVMDDRPRNDELTSFGMETDATQHRESREAVEQASEFGVDDRSDDALGGESDSGEQRGFEEFGGGVRENETLF